MSGSIRNSIIGSNIQCGGSVTLGNWTSTGDVSVTRRGTTVALDGEPAMWTFGNERFSAREVTIKKVLVTSDGRQFDIPDNDTAVNLTLRGNNNEHVKITGNTVNVHPAVRGQVFFDSIITNGGSTTVHGDVRKVTAHGGDVTVYGDVHSPSVVGGNITQHNL